MLSRQDIVRRKRMWDDIESKIHAFFSSRDFEHFKTPLIVRSPGMEPYLDPFPVPLLTKEGVGVVCGLITSPEYSMKKLLGAGFEKIYTITPVFRDNEPKNLHNIPEFTMLEWYAPGNYQDLMNETEDLLKFLLEDNTPWPRFECQTANMDEHGDPHVSEGRFFVTHYPIEQAALANIARRIEGGQEQETNTQSSDKRRDSVVSSATNAAKLQRTDHSSDYYAERFEAFADGFELCNGFSELIDSKEQHNRFEREQEERRKLGKTIFPIDEELLEALDNIKTPVYGNALGVDRLIMLKYGVKDINDIQLF